MYAIFAYIYHKSQPNVGISTIHGSHGYIYIYLHSELLNQLGRKKDVRSTLAAISRLQLSERSWMHHELLDSWGCEKGT